MKKVPSTAVLLLVIAAQFFSACALFSGGIRQAPVETLPAVRTAVEAYYRGAVEESLERLNESLADSPGNREALGTIAWIERERGNFKEAVRRYRELLEFDPANETAKQELFITLSAAGETDRAEELLPLVERNPSTLSYRILLHVREGNTEKAEAELRALLEIDENRPIAWYVLGRILAGRDPAEAEINFKKALKGDANLTVVLPYLAEALLEQKKLREARSLLLRIRNILPGRADLAEKLAETERALAAAEKKPPAAAAASAKRKHAEPPKAAPLGEDPRTTTLVRVGLAEEISAITLKTGGAFEIAALGQDVAVQGKAGELLTVRKDGGGLKVFDEEGSAIIVSHDPISLQYIEPENTTLIFDFLSESGNFFAVTEDRSYRGVLEFRPEDKGLTLVNILGLEEYLCGVLPAEMPASWPEEALRAQAIAARSYTLASLGGFASRGYDVHGSVLSAAYRGAGGETRETTEAILATRGKFLLAGGKPLRAYYSANHGGYGEDSRSVWGTEDFMQAVPDGLTAPREIPLAPPELGEWLKAKPAAYSARSPYFSPSSYRWEKWVAADDIASRIKRDKDVGGLLAIVPRGRGISGRMAEVEIIGTAGSLRIKGDRVRSRLGGLRSSLFTFIPVLDEKGRPEFFVFSGAGWGHGVGLDQSGAAGMAAAGFSAEEILKHYYPRAELVP